MTDTRTDTNALERLLAGLSVAPGTVVREVIATDTDPATEVPLIVIEGASPGPTLLVTAGVHGAEYASIEAANRLADLDPAELSGRVVVLPIVNRPSFAARSIYVNPLDGKNLNRVFPGRPDGTFAERLAHWLTETFVRHADLHIDLHGGDLNEALTPFVIHARGDEASARLAARFGLPNVIVSDSPGHSYSGSLDLGVPVILAESGGQGRFLEEDIEPLTRGIERVMQAEGMLAGEPGPAETRTFDAFHWLRSSHDGFWYLDVSVGDDVEEGQRVGVIRDFRGEVVHEAFAPEAGRVMFAVASLAINDGDPLVGIGA